MTLSNFDTQRIRIRPEAGFGSGARGSADAPVATGSDRHRASRERMIDG